MPRGASSRAPAPPCQCGGKAPGWALGPQVEREEQALVQGCSAYPINDAEALVGSGLGGSFKHICIFSDSYQWQRVS